MTADRRDFLKKSVLAGIGFTLAGNNAFGSIWSPSGKLKIRMGFIGTGLRGQVHLEECLKREDVDVVAICDPDKTSAIPRSLKIIEKYHGAEHNVKVFSESDEDFFQLLKMKNLDAVIISTPWEWHFIQAVAAMKSGIAVGLEVGGALNIQECWGLVETHEQTGVPFFGLENVCYRRDVMAVLNMVRNNVFGELLHLQGGYQHDLRAVLFNDGEHFYGHGVEFNKKGISEAKWRTNHYLNRNGDLYPTHGLGPIGTMIDLNRGNRLLTMSSVATKSRGLNKYIIDNGGKEHTNAKLTFQQGDIITTTITTSNGETIVLSHDTSSPRPYSLNFRVQGTQGLWMDDFNSLYIEGTSPNPHQWENADAYLEKYDHPLWKKYQDKAEGAGHGGMDFFVIHSLVESLKQNKTCALDVYDLATWYAITPLSEESIRQGGQVMQIPDFTNGKWMKRKPDFALTDDY